MAFYRLEPWGSHWAMRMAAAVAIACLAPWRKRGAKALRAGDIFPILNDDGDRAKLPSADGLREKLLAWAKAMGGKA